jgi:hypothetical protein
VEIEVEVFRDVLPLGSLVLLQLQILLLVLWLHCLVSKLILFLLLVVNSFVFFHYIFSLDSGYSVLLRLSDRPSSLFYLLVLYPVYYVLLLLLLLLLL